MLRVLITIGVLGGVGTRAPGVRETGGDATVGGAGAGARVEADVVAVEVDVVAIELGAASTDGGEATAWPSRAARYGSVTLDPIGKLASSPATLCTWMKCLVPGWSPSNLWTNVAADTSTGDCSSRKTRKLDRLAASAGAAHVTTTAIRSATAATSTGDGTMTEVGTSGTASPAEEGAHAERTYNKTRTAKLALARHRICANRFTPDLDGMPCISA
jgi:hypothetical protein